MNGRVDRMHALLMPGHGPLLPGLVCSWACVGSHGHVDRMHAPHAPGHGSLLPGLIYTWACAGSFFLVPRLCNLG